MGRLEAWLTATEGKEEISEEGIKRNGRAGRKKNYLDQGTIA